MNTSSESFTLSIVSHGQSSLIKLLLQDLSNLSIKNFDVIITINIPEEEPCYSEYSFPISIIRNAKPVGFGANHNAAFAASTGKWFVIINPDIRITRFEFESFLRIFQKPDVAAIAPIVVTCHGEQEDNARHFPTLILFIKRVLLRQKKSDYILQNTPYRVDWVGGMFVCFRRKAFEEVLGFDDRRFFMYLEDVDICERLSAHGWSTYINPYVQVVHNAQRASRRKIRHMYWHFVSAFRYLTGI